MSAFDPDVISNRVAQFTGLTVIDRFVRLIKQAGAYREEDTERDGFLSYASETHSVGAGLGLGFAIGASAQFSFLGVILSFVIYGNRGEKFLSPTLIRDIRKEVHYFLGGLFAGLILGIAVRLLFGLGVPMQDLWSNISRFL